MILKFMDWCDEQGEWGPLLCVSIGTLACMTGVALLVALHDILFDTD